MRIRLTDDAQAEFEHELDYLAQQHSGAVASFIDDIEEAKSLLLQYSGIGSPLFRGVRKLRLRRHPINLIYRVEGEIIVVYAFAPHKRKPGYWRQRIGPRSQR